MPEPMAPPATTADGGDNATSPTDDEMARRFGEATGAGECCSQVGVGPDVVGFELQDTLELRDGFVETSLPCQQGRERGARAG